MTRRSNGDAADQPLDPSWLTKLGGPTFVVVFMAFVLLGLAGRGILPNLETAQVGIIVTVFVGGEKAAKSIGRAVAKRRF